LSSQLYSDAVKSYNALHDTCNTSDHDPVLLHLKLSTARLCFSKKQFRVKTAWSRATEAQLVDYSGSLRTHLESVPLPINALRCTDINCSDAGHMAAINTYAEALSASCLSAANHSLPITSARGSGRIPGWVEYVEPYRQKSQFWHNLWVENGRPQTGAVSDIMGRTRAARAVRYVKRNEQDIINDRFASALLDNRNRDLSVVTKHVLVIMSTQHLTLLTLRTFLRANIKSCT